MILKIFTVYDSKALAYIQPFYMPEEGQAIRIFGQTCQDKEHAYGKAPQDYTLFTIGEWDDNSAIFTTKAPKSLGNGIEFISPNTSEQTHDTERDTLQPGTTG